VGVEGGSMGVYGSRVGELDKFYKILANADEKNQAQRDFPQYNTNSDSFYDDQNDYTLERDSTSSFKQRGRGDSHHTVDSADEPSSYASSDCHSDKGREFRRSATHSPLPNGRLPSSCNISMTYQSAIQVWSWSCQSSKPMLLSKEVFSNCNSVSNLRIVYPTTVEVVGEAISNFFRCETILRKREYSAWEHILKVSAMINRLLSHGTNQLPRSALFSNLMTICFVLFLFVDIACICYLSLTYWCVWGNRTECNDQTGVILMHSVWPGALIMAPLMGLRVMILNSTGTVARQFLCWSRLTFINFIMMVLIYLKWRDNADTFLNIPMLLVYLGSRLFQTYHFDSLVAATENKRTSRGWNGLYTSIANYENQEFS